ncbi:MAG: type II CRISPR-associated endonuclease Cas1 [Chloroflexota bacterium]|nr:type II CRISPR-associated endonuclease Cas1 [Chloroflexota bacterium]MDE2883652.1 type II CRISPR-associated endonuclease Cas1 [Chloroflexota bacterium]
MIGRVVEIASEGQHLSRHRGFLSVRKDSEELARIPLDDIAVLLCNTEAHGLTYTNDLLVDMANRGIPAVLCGANYLPVAWLWPVEGHHVQSLRMRSQLEASLPLRKRLWQALVKAKIAQQQNVLDVLGVPGGGLLALAQRVRSGDPDNVEAQAARRYWPLVFGSNFRRDRSAGGANAFLNYGYTVLRAAVARSVAAAGLHPSIGIHHHNRANPFCLVDDLMEPFRPLVDYAVVRLAKAGHREMTSETKRALAGVLVMDLRTERGTTPLQTCIERAAQSAAQSYESCKPIFTFPGPPLVDSSGDTE